jgi:hypothetical protein
MLTPDTFLLPLYVGVDDFCKAHLPREVRPGPCASLTRSEVVTLAIFSAWAVFPSERAFYRYARRRLGSAFPRLPDRSQYNRLVRRHEAAITAFFLHLVEQLQATASIYEALDGTAVVVRNAKRRGEGWLAGQADIGYSNRLGWYEGLYLLASVTPEGILTGFGVAPASTKDQTAAESFFALRADPQHRLPSVGRSRPGPYACDKGFEGLQRHRQWSEAYGAEVVAPPKRSTRKQRWPRALRRWLAGIRQIIETVNGHLHGIFRLDHERPHVMQGFLARLAAMCALHNFCIWLNRQSGRPALAFADLMDW